MQRRRAGLLLPLFSIRSESDWGVGELPDFARLAPLLKRAGVSVVMTLPLLEPSPGQESPYAPVSAFALDPLYIDLDSVPEFIALGGRAALTDDERGALEHARRGASVRHETVRWLKHRCLVRCYAHFEAKASAERRAAFDSFVEEHAGWLADYTLFRVLKDHQPQSWRDWPEALRHREPGAVADARKAHAEDLGVRAYAQWIAFEQLAAARAALSEAGIALGGDEPFLVADDSADVWGRQELYRFDATVGAPPDAFSATGQDWGLPPYRWDRIAETRYALFRERGLHASRLFDLVRIDHVVGLYRTYCRPLDQSTPYFVPDAEHSQLEQGEAVLRAWSESGLSLIAEDLGVIPDFVRHSLDRLQIPGFRVLRWEERDGRFRVPQSWPTVSVATNGTHDTETTAVWWESLPDSTWWALREVPEIGAIPEEIARPYHDGVKEAIMRSLYASPSVLSLVPIQDVFGLRERINTPNTVGPHNWSWRMPWSLESLGSEEHLLARLDELGELARSTGRAS